MSHIAVVLAAGHGTRMRSTIPKVLHEVAGQTIIERLVDAVLETKPERTVVVVGHRAEEVVGRLPEAVETVLQEVQLGTGHAASVALEHVGPLDPGAGVMILPGDTPLVDGALLDALLEARTGDVAVSMLTAEATDPTGYGRVVRANGSVMRIVEEVDATPDQRAIREINAGMYVFDGDTLAGDLARVDSANSKGEQYLTDVVGIAAARGDRIAGVVADERTVSGVNTQEQLAEANREARRRINERWMEAGVIMVDPEATYISDSVEIEPGALLRPGCHLEGATRIGRGAVVGPDVFAVDSIIGAESLVWYAVLRQADVGEQCEVGPYASLRPGTVLRNSSKAGTFVEMKNSVVGEGSKVPHLTYMGDATVGTDVNVGAGTITCNYDGYAKHPTVIEDGAFIGSSTMLVAPVTVGEGAITGAGSVVTSDVEAGSLAIERNVQRSVPGYAERLAARYRAASDDDTGQ